MSFLKSLVAKLNAGTESKKITQNIGWLFLDNFFRYGVGMLVGVFVARSLGPERYGVLSYAVVFVSFFMAIVDLGLQKIVVRELVKRPKEKFDILSNAFFMMLGSGILFAFFAPLVVYIIRPTDIETIILVGILSAGLLFHCLKFIAYFYESEVKSKQVVWTANIAFAVGVCIKIYAVLTSGDLRLLAFATVIDTILANCLLLFLLPKELKSFWKHKINWKLCKELLKDAYPLIISLLAVKIYADIDQIMIRDLYSTKETGLYSIAVKLSMVWLFVPSSIFVSVFPNLINTRKTDVEQYKAKLQRLYNLVVFLSYIVAIAFTIVGDYIILLFLGEAYAGSAFFLKILIWSSIFATLGGARTLFLLSENMTKTYMVTILIGCTINIVLNFIFIPIYGGTAACITTLITTFVAGVGINFFIPTLRETGMMQLKSLCFPKFWN